MSRAKPSTNEEERQRRITLMAADALREAWLASSSKYWENRARQLEAARPRPGDFAGQSTIADQVARSERLTAAAAACRARATGADGWTTTSLSATAVSIEESAA